jgi:hypothetical protein
MPSRRRNVTYIDGGGTLRGLKIIRGKKAHSRQQQLFAMSGGRYLHLLRLVTAGDNVFKNQPLQMAKRWQCGRTKKSTNETLAKRLSN